MAGKSERVEVRMDPELREYLRARSIATGAPISELIRRDVQLARYADQQAARKATK